MARTQYTLTCTHCTTVFSSRHRNAKYCSQSCYHATLKIPIADRFWRHVDKSGECWLWTAHTGTWGHGYVSVNGRPTTAHRVAWTLLRGPIPEGLNVCHDCPGGDNPACVNPDHLFLGTQGDNVRDMVSKGRAATGDRSGTRTHPERLCRGENRADSKLTDTQVVEIRRLLKEHVSQGSLGERFGVSRSAIQAIANGRTWKHVQPSMP